jgi:acyl-CoA reductase-like NAD-dependent aldehyde dehydrogenase
VAIIGTWNYPLFLNAGQIIQALTAGNAVIWKPSEVTPRFADLLHGLIHEALGSEDQALFQRLPATRDAGPALVEADIDHLVFTGSANVGSKLAARLGERLISSTLELSGCDMQLILADADVDLAAKAAWFGSTLNRGQTCIAVRRSLVHRSLYPGFCEKLRGFVEGAGECRLILPSQVAQLQRLLHQAQQAGAKIVGSPPTAEGTACRPVVVLDARPEMAVCRDASFAPVLAVLPFDTVEDALQIEQKCGYALGSSIFTRDINQAETLAARLRPGLVAINDAVVPSAHPATPFGGRGQSGWGVTQGAEGLLEMTIPQVVSVKSGNFRPHYEGAIDPSKTVAQAELLAALLEASHGRTIWQRLSGWWRTIQAGRKL